MKEKVHAVHRVREFNRFYMPAFDLLGNHYLGSEYSATEARVLFEVYDNDGCNAAFIARAMNLDKSYLSRIIKRHEKNGYLLRMVSTTDSRSFDLHLTALGIERTEVFIQKSNQQIGDMIESLNAVKCKELIHALDTITDILKECITTK